MHNLSETHYFPHFWLTKQNCLNTSTDEPWTTCVCKSVYVCVCVRLCVCVISKLHVGTESYKSETFYRDTDKNATNVNCFLFCCTLSKSFAADFLVPSAFFAPLRSRTITSTLSSVCTCRRWKHRMVHDFDLILSSEPAHLDSQNMLGATHTYKHTLTHVFAGVNVFMLYQVFPTTGWGTTQSRVHLPKLLSSFEQLQLVTRSQTFLISLCDFLKKKLFL